MDNFTVRGKLPGFDAQGVQVAIVEVIIDAVSSDMNSDPIYTGPKQMFDLVVGQARQMQGSDADGDTIKWTMHPEDKEYAEMTPGGLMTTKKEFGKNPDGTLAPIKLRVQMDDGQPAKEKKKC